MRVLLDLLDWDNDDIVQKQGDGGRLVDRVWNFREAGPHDVTYMTEEGSTAAGVVITDSASKVHPEDPSVYPTIVVSKRPRRTAAQVAKHFEVNWTLTQGVFSYFQMVRWGERFECGPGTVLGSRGFGFEVDQHGYFYMPHLGGVHIGNDVEIGANCTIDRGTFSHTRIGSGTKIDNLVHIAHNCQIGEGVMIPAGVTFSGSVTVGDGAWIGVGATIMQGVTIGRRATIGAGAVVLRDVEPGETVVGHHRTIDTKESQLGVIR